MIIVNAILYLSSAWYIILACNQFFIIKILPYWFVTKNIGNYRKYDIFFIFCFTENMIFPPIAENQENMIFSLSIFTKMLFLYSCIAPVPLQLLSHHWIMPVLSFWKCLAFKKKSRGSLEWKDPSCKTTFMVNF